MEFLGIGPTELALIILIALIVIGPKDLEKTAKTVGRWLNNLVRSDEWQALRRTSKEISNLPTKLMREANLEELEKDVGKIGKEIEDAADFKGFGTWSNPAAAKPKPPQTGPTSAEVAAEKPATPEQTPPPVKETTPETNKESDNNA